jgi:enterobacterial common antigen flippase
MTGFRWSSTNLRTGLLFVLAISAVFILLQWLPLLPGLAVGALATLLSTVISVRLLTQLLPSSRLPRPLQWLLKPLGSRPTPGVALSPSAAQDHTT